MEKGDRIQQKKLEKAYGKKHIELRDPTTMKNQNIQYFGTK